ncbi:basal body-orientation factor 1-like [Anableps anableps]
MATKKAKLGNSRKTTKDQKPELKQGKKQNDKIAEMSCELLELTLKRTQKDLAHYQKAHYDTVRKNEELRGFLNKAEMSYFGTTDYWQKELKDRDEKIKILEDQLKRQVELGIAKKLEWENEKKEHFRMFREDILERKAAEAQTKKKIAKMRKQMQISKEEYRENLRKKDEKYSLLKKELEGEGNRKYNEKDMFQIKVNYENVIFKLEDKMKNVQKEKNCLNINLTNALAKIEDLSQVAYSLSKDKLSLGVDKNMLTSTLKKNTGVMVLKEKMLTEAMAKASFLEQALNKMEKEMGEKEKRSQITIQASEVELDKLQKIIAMREKEIYQVKQLARTIVEKRKDLEVFFHEALDHVRQEIADDRMRYKEESYQDYRQKFREGIAGKTKFPPICTFHQSPHSTNSVYSGMKAAEKWPHCLGKEVYKSDLTWEQKEKVLTLLFAKMNGNTESAVNMKIDLCES